VNHAAAGSEKVWGKTLPAGEAFGLIFQPGGVEAFQKQ
jgi:hypothetical protein